MQCGLSFPNTGTWFFYKFLTSDIPASSLDGGPWQYQPPSPSNTNPSNTFTCHAHPLPSSTLTLRFLQTRLHVMHTLAFQHANTTVPLIPLLTSADPKQGVCSRLSTAHFPFQSVRNVRQTIHTHSWAPAVKEMVVFMSVHEGFLLRKIPGAWLLTTTGIQIDNVKWDLCFEGEQSSEV